MREIKYVEIILYLGFVLINLNFMIKVLDKINLFGFEGRFVLLLFVLFRCNFWFVILLLILKFRCGSVVFVVGLKLFEICIV